MVSLWISFRLPFEFSGFLWTSVGIQDFPLDLLQFSVVLLSVASFSVGFPFVFLRLPWVFLRSSFIFSLVLPRFLLVLLRFLWFYYGFP